MASQKLSPWKKQTSSCLLLIFYFFEKQHSLSFSIVLIFSHFMCVCVCVFLLFSSFFVFVFFWCFHHFLRFSNHQKNMKKSLSRKYLFLQTFSFWTFFLEGNIFEFFVQKLSFEISFKKRNFFKKKKNKIFFIHMRRRAHTRVKALLTIAASRDFVARVKVSCAFSCHWSRPRDIRCIKPSLFFPIFSKKTLLFSNCFFFWFLCFICSSIFSWQNITFYFFFFFSLFLSSCFLSFFSLLMFCQGDLMAEDKTRHQERWVKTVVGMVTQIWKKEVSLVGVFLSMTEGVSWWTSINEGVSWWTSINQEECVGWLFLARFGSNCVFPVIYCLVCDTDSPQDTRKWRLVIISLCSLSLSTFVLLMLIQDGTREAEKLNLEESTVCVEDQRKIVEKQLHGAALVNYEEFMRDHHDRLKLLSNKAWAKNQPNDTKGRNLPNDWGERDAPLQSFGAGQDSLKEDGGVVNTRWWSVEMMEEHGWRNGHEKKMNENCGRDETVVWWVGLFIFHMVLLKDVQKLSWYHRFSSLPCVIQRQISQFRVFRNCGSYAKCRKSTRWTMSLSWCIGFSQLFKTRKKKPQSFRELCEEPDRMFSKNCVVWTSTWA